MRPGFREFEFDLPVALLANLVSTFDTMEGAPLLLSNVSELPDAQGVYQLIYEGQIVYIGKTDGQAGLRKRLSRHAVTVQHRRDLNPEHVHFRALRVFVFTAIDLETQLIRHYGGYSRVVWNNSGFGSNDPGRERDTTSPNIGGFDDRYPIDLDIDIEVVTQATATTVGGALDMLRKKVPYKIRAEASSANRNLPHPDFAAAVEVDVGLTTARQVMLRVLANLNSGWQATVLPGRVILYRENRTYAAGTVIGRS